MAEEETKGGENQEQTGDSKPSILGIDPPDETPEETPEETPKETPKEEKTGKVELSEDELQELKDKENLYDMVTSDPHLAQYISDFFRKKTGRVPENENREEVTRTKATKENNEEELPPHIQKLMEENKSMKEVIEKMQEQQAINEVNAFRKEHPDMDEYRREMGVLIRNNNMSIEDAYNYAKYAKQQKSGGKEKVSQPTTETHDRGSGIERDETGSFKELEREIADSKATPRLEDAIAKAFKGASKMHSE